MPQAQDTTNQTKICAEGANIPDEHNSLCNHSLLRGELLVSAASLVVTQWEGENGGLAGNQREPGAMRALGNKPAARK